jgi:hypothetical protein
MEVFTMDPSILTSYEKYQVIILIFQLIVVALGVWVALLQLRKMAHAIQISARSNRVQVVTHCTLRYQNLMRELPDTSDEQQESWWYAYWGIMSDEFFYFRQGLLEQEIYEIWKVELAGTYHRAPKDGWLKRSESHRKFLTGNMPDSEEQHEFYSKFPEISKDENVITRSRKVRSQVKEFAPKDLLRI